MMAGSMIGEGEFGSVWEGVYSDADGRSRRVAAKKLNTLEGAGEAQKDEFAKEAQLMMRMDHQCVVQLIGELLLWIN